ncbi:amidase [Colletotrichum filicis]|nr:amidase [Colletotrichum filicis]
MAITTIPKGWRELAQVCIDIQKKSIPKEYELASDQIPPKDHQNVLDIPNESGILTTEEIRMTEQDASSLLEKYKSGQWTVKQVVTAFLKKTTMIHQLTNFATEILAEDALQKANELDAYFQKTGQLVGPLHGIPISVKEHIGMGGHITHAGFVSKIRNIPLEDALSIQILKKAGAVIHVRTNQPQSLMVGKLLFSVTINLRGPKPYLDTFAESGEPVLPLTEHAFRFSKAEPLTVAENWNLNYRREAYRRDYHALMKHRGVDVILCPAYVGAGVLQGGAEYWNYTAIWNVLDQPAAILPSGLKVDKAIDKPEEDYTPRNDHDAKEWKAYDADLFHDMPICLQLVGKHFQDEEVLQATKLVDRILKE